MHIALIIWGSGKVKHEFAYFFVIHLIWSDLHLYLLLMLLLLQLLMW